METSIKQKILSFLQEKKNWQYGGVIEDFIRSTDGHKASNASRRCRELEDEGKIESQYVNVSGVSNKVVQYKIRSSILIGFGEKQEICCSSYKYFKIHAQNCREISQIKQTINSLF